MNYQYLWDYSTEAIANNCIRRLPDGAIIPFDPLNIDYQAYLRWLDAGNTPLPPDPPDPMAV
jgi:hypothetical protein